jgi:hypothetical protein
VAEAHKRLPFTKRLRALLGLEKLEYLISTTLRGSRGELT